MSDCQVVSTEALMSKTVHNQDKQLGGSFDKGTKLFLLLKYQVFNLGYPRQNQYHKTTP